jgi:HSP20 family protein
MNMTVSKEQQQPLRQTNGQSQTWLPPVDIYEAKDAYFLRADMPGVAKEGLEITAEGTTLTVTGKRTLSRQSGPSASVEYRRVFELDPMIDYSKIKARIEQGVVTVELPKAERVKPRKIKIGE